ncbi:MAG: phage integrase SAM-like domain-containing protein [Rikenellaceae bacterium]
MAVTFNLAHKERESSVIMLDVLFKGKRYKISTGESVLTKHWNTSKKRAKVLSSYSIGAGINEVLDKWEVSALQTVNYFKDYDKAPEKVNFVEIFKGVHFKDDENKEPEVKVLGFTDFMKIYIERYRGVRSKSTVGNYNGALKKLQDFEVKYKCKLKFEDIDIQFYNKFSSYHHSLGFKDNTLGTVIKVIKQVHTEARIVDKLHNDVGVQHKGFVTISKNVDNIYLSKEELLLMRDLVINYDTISALEPTLTSGQIKLKVHALNVARDTFLIGAFTGLRVSDYTHLQKATISDKYIKIHTVKTKQDLVIPIHPIVRDILNRGFDTSTIMADVKLNKHIKVVARLAGLTETVKINSYVGGESTQVESPKYSLISSHTARRSFATNAYKAGVPTLAIMKITGHTRESTFLKYIKVSAEENADMLLEHDFYKM